MQYIVTVFLDLQMVAFNILRESRTQLHHLTTMGQALVLHSAIFKTKTTMCALKLKKVFSKRSFILYSYEFEINILFLFLICSDTFLQFRYVWHAIR